MRRNIEMSNMILVQESDVLKLILVSNNNIVKSSTHFDALLYGREK